MLEKDRLYKRKPAKISKARKTSQTIPEQHLNKWCDKFFEKLEAETGCAYQLIAYIGIIGLGKILKV